MACGHHRTRACAVSERVAIPKPDSLSERDIREVRWQEATFVEHNYTVEYAKYVQHHRLVGLLTRLLRGRAEVTVVDLGCGDGCLLFAICRALDRTDIRFIGIDLDRQALERAAKRIAYRGYSNVELRFGTVTDTGLPEACADVVICSEVLEHLLHPRLLFEEIRRLLKPDGTAVLTTPNLSNYPRRVGQALDRLFKGRLRRSAYAGMVDCTPETGFTLQEGILGHVSEQPALVWRQLARDVGFQARLLRGGTLVYGYPWLARHGVLFGFLCLVEGALDLLPWWYDTSYDLLMVLRKGTA